MVALRGIVIWVILIFAEMLHGIARAAFLAPYVGDFRARQIAVLTGSMIILAITLVCVRWIRASSASELLSVGVLWLGLTLAFEILFGRFVLGYSWERIASDYNLLDGGLLPVGLVVLTVSPLIAGKLRGVI